MEYKVIIFDFFGVISAAVGPRWFEGYFPKDKAAALKEQYVPPLDVGAVSEAIFFEQIAEHVSKTAHAVREEWLKLAVIDEEVKAFVATLKNRYKIALCSNAPAPFLREVIEEHNLGALFDTVVISSEVHLLKPDPAIFQLILDRFGAKPEEAVFIDDTAANAEGAKAVGMQGIVFSTIEELQKSLKLLGITY